ncbi:MAG TPA: hypothetical protein DCM40_39765 [Maribacter sp.]|nr:hypothetical protein [Maribacter sp.]
MKHNPYDIIARAILKTAERSYKSMKEIDKMNKRFDRLETKIDQIAQKIGLYKNRAYSDTIRPFDESERNRATERKEINKPDTFDGK